MAVGGFAFALLAIAYPFFIGHALESGTFGFLQPLMEHIMGRYGHGATVTGIACLMLGVGLSAWRYFTRSKVSAADARQASWLARLLARMVD